MADIDLDPRVAQRVEIEVKYEGYIKREEEAIAKLHELEMEKIPDGLDYARIHGLSNEARNKLAAVRPADLGQASRIQGVSPSEILLLLLYLKRRTKNE